jgi:hypothetical protein
MQALPISQTQLETKSMQVGKQMNLGVTSIDEIVIRNHHYGPSEVLM